MVNPSPATGIVNSRLGAPDEDKPLILLDFSLTAVHMSLELTLAILKIV